MQVSQNTGNSFDICVFHGSAVSLDRHPLGYAPGERHDLIVFLRQSSGDDADPMAVEHLMRQAGWRKSMLSLLFILPNHSAAVDRDAVLRGSYHDALEYGGAIIVCGTPV